MMLGVSKIEAFDANSLHHLVHVNQWASKSVSFMCCSVDKCMNNPASEKL